MKYWNYILIISLFFIEGCFFKKNPSNLSGNLNPEFYGRTFSRFAVSAVNIPIEFRRQYEVRMAAYIHRSIDRNKYPVVELRNLFQFGQQLNVKNAIIKLKKQGIEVLILFNIHNSGGTNLNDITTLENAMEASINHKHNPASVTYYGSSEVLIFEINTGKLIWKGGGRIKAKPYSLGWFKASAKKQTKYLYRFLLREKFFLQETEVSD